MNILVMAEDNDSLEKLVSYISPVFAEPLLKYCYGNISDDNIIGIDPYIAFLKTDNCAEGLRIAALIKDNKPKCNLIIIDDGSCAEKVWALHPSGYICGEISSEKILYELSDLRYPPDIVQQAKLQISCIGNFDVFLPDGQRLYFLRSKSKEAFAYLVHRHGSACTVREIAAVLFEDQAYDTKQRQYIQKIMSSMMKTLRDANADDVIIKHFNSIALDVSKVYCDSYCLSGLDEETARNFQNEYMRCYSWAETIPSFSLWLK